MKLHFLVASSILGAGLLTAQETSGLVTAPEGFTRPQAFVMVQQREGNLQEVVVSFVPEDYSQTAIQRHVAAWKAHSGLPLLTSRISERSVPLAEGKKLKIVEWIVTTRGLVDRERGALEIQAIARTLAPLRDLDVLWLVSNFPYRGFGTFKSPAAAMNAAVAPDKVHMLVHISVDDPSQIVIPSVYTPPPTVDTSKPKSTRPVAMYILLAIAGSVLVGVLVYYVLRLSASPART